MNVTMSRAQVKDESVAEVEAAVQKTFATIEEARPEGVRYASCRIPGTSTS
ncbi:MAG TPA: hypothetical protein VIL48_03685 [Acidimicrobiales bacterium]